MFDQNPYMPPETRVDDVPSESLTQTLAARGSRLAAQIVDTLILGLPLGVIVYYGIVADSPNAVDPPVLLLVGCALVVVAIGIVNLYFLSASGQTMGKKLLGIRIVRTSGEPAALLRIVFLRIMFPGLLGNIPFAGAAFALTDSLFIFRSDRRCLHDLMADTKVVVA